VKILTIDFETFWDIDFTLSKMTTEAYVRDARFKTHLVGVKNGDAETVILPANRIQEIFNKIDWADTAVLCQHAHFDGLILSHGYDVHPAFFFDTLSMFRHLYPAESASLMNQTKVLGLPAKGNGYDIVNTKGLTSFTPQEYASCAAYCKLDCDLTWRIFNILKPKFPVSEMRLIDMTVKMFTDPILRLNVDLLEEAKQDEIETKRLLMERVAHDKDALASNPKFANILMSIGIDPPKKISPAAIKNGKVHAETAGEAPIGIIPTLTKKEKAEYLEREGVPHVSDVWAYAFGKSDEEFKRMLEHDDPTVRALVEARMGVKSTIKSTRTERFLGIAERGPWPVYLNYAGAHTLRWSGGDKMNPQNLVRGSKLRESIEAPEGHVIVVRDLSAIEARVLAWLSGQEDVVETFRRGEDVYCDMFKSISGRVITKKDASERFLGKVVVLGCGYQMSWKKLQSMLRIGMLGDSGRILGEDIATPLGVNLQGFLHRFAGYVQETLPPGGDLAAHALHCACTEAIIRAFRDNKPMIPRFWQTCQESFEYILRGESFKFGRFGVVETCREGLKLPSGMLLRYTELECKAEGRRKEYSILKNRRKGERGKMYGGLCCENIVQRLSRDIIAEHMLKIGARYHVATMTHDEIVCVVPEERAEECYSFMGVVMATPPVWAPDLPLGSEGGFARNYSK